MAKIKTVKSAALTECERAFALVSRIGDCFLGLDRARGDVVVYLGESQFRLIVKHNPMDVAHSVYHAREIHGAKVVMVAENDYLHVTVRES